jgi:hypothetical protein
MTIAAIIIAMILLCASVSPRQTVFLTTTKLPTTAEIRVSYFARDGESSNGILMNPEESRRFIELLRQSQRSTPAIGGGILSVEFRFARRTITSRALLADDKGSLSFPIYESFFQKLWGEPVYYTMTLNPASTPRLTRFLEDFSPR